VTRALYDESVRRRQVNHGWRIDQLERRPGVAELPIERMYPIMQPIPLFDDTLLYQAGNTINDYDNIGMIMLDAAVPGNAVRNNFQEDASGNPGVLPITRTSALGDSMIFPVRIGPKGVWGGLNFAFKKGPNYGKFKISYMGPATEGSGPGWEKSCDPPFNEGGGSWQSIREMADAGTSAAAQWIDYHEPSGLQEFNCYAAAPQNGTLGILGDFRIVGDYGDILTEFCDYNNVCSGCPGPNFGADIYSSFWGDGGPGIYWVKIEVADKDASSTGYDLAFYSITWSLFDDVMPQT
jgi:hypothetical protein